MSEFEILREENEKQGRYVIKGENGDAELTYNITSPSLRIADHTGVPDSMRGTGAGKALVERLVADARAEGWKIVPLCPFVNRERAKHPEWADLFNV